MSAVDEMLLQRPGQADAPPANGGGPVPSRGLAVVTCMDTRIAVLSALGFRRGEIHVLRNAGGTVTEDVIRSLAISQHKLGTGEVVVMQHTSCGMGTVTEEGFKDELEKVSGLRPTWAVEAFADVVGSVRSSVERIRRCPFLPHTDRVRGFVYDVETEELAEVS